MQCKTFSLNRESEVGLVGISSEKARSTLVGGRLIKIQMRCHLLVNVEMKWMALDPYGGGLIETNGPTQREREKVVKESQI